MLSRLLQLRMMDGGLASYWTKHEEWKEKMCSPAILFVCSNSSNLISLWLGLPTDEFPKGYLLIYLLIHLVRLSRTVRLRSPNIPSWICIYSWFCSYVYLSDLVPRQLLRQKQLYVRSPRSFYLSCPYDARCCFIPALLALFCSYVINNSWQTSCIMIHVRSLRVGLTWKLWTLLFLCMYTT